MPRSAPTNRDRGTFFNGGVRAFDISNPYQPRKSPISFRARPNSSPVGAIQINDVWVDERGIVYAVDRFAGGLYILEMTSDAPLSAQRLAGGRDPLAGRIPVSIVTGFLGSGKTTLINRLLKSWR